MDFFNTSFYDKESTNYSEKRYLVTPNSYNSFFFKRRLKILLHLLKKNIKDNNLVLIEDGCADGFVLRRIAKEFKAFSLCIGVDISPKMIEKAILSKTENIIFSLKDNLDKDLKSDIFLAVGFVSPGIFQDEFGFIESHIKEDGIVILSLVSNNSIYAKLKLKDKEIFSDYWSFKEYEDFLKKYFHILDCSAYGIFIPKLWAFPKIAGFIQNIFESIFCRISPNLFQEKLYVLKKKR